MLMGFGDFDEFKSLMLSYKEQVEYERAHPGSMGELAPVVTSLSISGGSMS